MPATTTKNPMLDKLARKGLAKATAAHAKDETEYGSGGEVPAGVSGVAKLTTAKLDEYKSGDSKGEGYLQLRGVVRTPEEHFGKQLMVMVPLCDDPASYQQRRTFDENVQRALNEIRKVGGDTSNMATQQDWENVLAALQQSEPYFHYHTYATKPPKNPPKDWRASVKQIFDRPAPDFVEGQGTGVDDNTGTSSGGNGQPVDQQGGDTPAEVDWDSVAAQAVAGDRDCEVQLIQACKEIGVDAEALETWQLAADALNAAAAGEGSGEQQQNAEQPQAEWKPKLDDIYPFKPKGARAAQDAKVTAVFASTLNLKRVSDGQTFKAVPWTSEPATLGGNPI